MHHATYLEGLLTLHAEPAPEARLRSFRQSMASLGLATSIDGPSPFEGLDTEALAASIAVAEQDGLIGSLGWLSPSAAAIALYEIAAALPPGTAQRELRRRALTHLSEGNAATFVAIATRMVARSARGLSGAAVRARVALALALPGKADVDMGPLALALVSRGELAREWIGVRGTGSLPDRRLAARLIEGAALEAARRATRGDRDSLALFRGAFTGDATSDDDAFRTGWHALLADREGLVWRHVAVARGLLSVVLAEAAREHAALVSPELSPTEWRRGATSLVASIAVDPEGALARSLALVDSELYRRDPGLAAAMLWGLGRAADTEPEAAERLLVRLAETHPLGIAESLTELQAELGPIAERARELCAEALAQSLAAGEPDPGLAALGQSILGELTAGNDPLQAAVRSALYAFGDVGSREAYARAQKALAVATERVAELTRSAPTGEIADTAPSRRASVAWLRAIDLSLLESGTLKSLLALDRRVSDELAGEGPLDQLEDQVTGWLLQAEAAPTPSSAEQPTVHLRQLRALLHAVDGEPAEHDDAARRARSRAKSLATCRAMAPRLLAERGSPLRRIVGATLARALDALVRDGAADASDVAAYVAMSFTDAGDLEILVEASMRPEIVLALQMYRRLIRETKRAQGAAEHLDELRLFATELPMGASHRMDVFRRVLLRLSRALDAIHASTSLQALAADGAAEASPIVALESALGMLAQLMAGAAARCGQALDVRAVMARRDASSLFDLLSAAAIATAPSPELALATTALVDDARQSLPDPFAEAVAAVVSRIPTLTRVRTMAASATSLATESSLPAWLPQRRMLGGFYVHRRLGHGGLGTVFEVSRAEDRHDPRSERFALKVPEYDATAARSLSETEFLRHFREEAGALLAIPEHPNLARFVTFDAGAKPKPVLVMELIEGTTCEKLITSRTLSLGLAVSLLDGTLAGLGAMHGVGLAHLDLKPANVILRNGREAVLVDFGLAGRHLRPGCGSGGFGAPEVWLAEPSALAGSPMPADLYGFGCLAYEVLTGKALFDAPSEVELISAHIAHDGFPDGVRRLAANAALEPLAMLLFDCLRHDPAKRPAATKVRADLRALSARLSGLRWPL
jgi:hypothetical protein